MLLSETESMEVIMWEIPAAGFFIIGLLVGWATPEPLILKNLQDKIWGELKSKVEAALPPTPPAA